MDFNLLQAFTGRKPRTLDHLPLTRRYAVRIASDNAHLNDEGQRTIPSLQTLSRLTGSWKVCFLECLQGVILRNGMRHLEAARWHTDLVLKREKQADHIGMRAAAVLARSKDGNDETL
jgi:hypothetical protein